MAEGIENSWAQIKNAQSRERQLGKLEKLRADLDRERSENFRNRMGPGDDAAQRVRSIIEGDVNTYSDDVRQANRRKDDLRGRQADLQTEMTLLRPQFKRACRQRSRHLEKTDEWADRGMRTKIPTSEGSIWTLVGLTAALVVLESVLLRRPIEDMVRDIFPEWGSVTVPALLVLVGLVGLATYVAILAGKEWKRFHILGARSDVAGEDSDAFVGTVSQTRAQVITLLAIVLQVILFVIRFQVDTGSSDGRRVFILVSALLMMLALSVGFVEYRRHGEEIPSEITWNEDLIARYLAMHTEAFTHIPRQLVKADRLKLEAVKAALHDHQRHSTQLDGSEVMIAINDLIDRVDNEMDELVVPEYAPPADLDFLDLPEDPRIHTEEHM